MAGLTDSFAAPIPTTFARLEVEQTGVRQSVVRSDIAPTPRGNVAFELVRTYVGFEALEAEWNELFERCGKAHQIFQSFNWNWQWAKAFLDATADDIAPSPIAVLTGRINGRLVSLWPMIVTRKGGLTELSWMGEPVSQYGDVLLDSTVADPLALLRAGWAHICLNLKPDLARLRKVRGDAAITPLLDTLSSLHTAELEAPYIDLTRAADFTAYEERFPNRARRNRRRQMRRLEEAGTITYKHLSEGIEASALAATAIDLKRQWLIDRGYVSPALADVRMARFMTEVASSNNHPTATRVSVLQSAAKPAAIQIGFTSKNTRVLHVIVYDKTFEKMAAGVLHLGTEQIMALCPYLEWLQKLR